MPQFAVAYLATSSIVGAGVLATGIAATTIASALVYGSLLVASVGYSNYARRKAERAASATLQDRTIPIRASDAPQTIIYGETRVSGVIIYGASHDGGTDLGIDDEVTLVYALAGHELSAINDVWFNDETVGTLDANGEVTLGSDWYKSERVGATASFVPSSNSQTLTISEAAPIESIDSVAWVNDSGDDRAQFVARPGVDYTASVGAKTITLIDNGQVNFIGVPLVV
ncbi:MAG: Enterobacteria phage JenP1, partial [Pseudomonadota bacterium]